MLILLLCIFGFYFFILKSNTTVKIVQYTISNIRLDIPKTYHYGEYEKRGRWPNIKPGIHESTHISIVAILPNLDAINEQNKHLFKELGWGRKIRIRLISHEIYPLNKIVDSYRTQGLMLQNSIQMEGLESYDLKPTKDSKPFREMFIKKVDGEIELIGKCDLEKKDTSPSCKFDRIYSNGLHLQYVYSRNQLKHWKEIDKKVTNLMHGFCTEKSNCLTLN